MPWLSNLSLSLSLSLSGAIDAEDLCTMKSADFESADTLAAKERIRAAALQGALRKEDQTANSNLKDDVLTAVSEGEIAASARRKLEQDKEEQERRRRKSEESKKAREGGLDAGSNQSYPDMDVAGGGADDDDDSKDINSDDTTTTSAGGASRKRGRQTNIDAGTRYAKQLKPSGVTVVDYVPGAESRVIREGVGYVKHENDPLPARPSDNTTMVTSTSTTTAATGAGGGAGGGGASTGTEEGPDPAPSPKSAGLRVKKGKGILGLLKKKSPTVAGDGGGYRGSTSVEGGATDALMDIEGAADKDGDSYNSGTGTEGNSNSSSDALYVLSNKGNASLEIMRSGAAWLRCFGMISTFLRLF